ncbi:MAG: hypothetical protein NTX24_00710 [Candidatus Pacearchaeota archaeon]|nr:hypothetical protein [Candidatus Pacearchaeota archaeon]
MAERKRTPLIKRLSMPGWQGWILVAGLALFIAVPVVCSSIDNAQTRRLKSLYQTTLKQYADVDSNRIINPDEEKAFLDSFQNHVRTKPGYEGFSWDPSKPSTDYSARTLMSLLQEYRPVPLHSN